jgi:hypothetical protein
MAIGSTQPLSKMSIRNLPGGKNRPARRADNLAPSVCRISENVGALTSLNTKGLYRDKFTFTLPCILVSCCDCEFYCSEEMNWLHNNIFSITGIGSDSVII